MYKYAFEGVEIASITELTVEKYNAMNVRKSISLLNFTKSTQTTSFLF